MAAVAGKADLFVVVTRTNQIWLINRADTDCELSAMELSGFNTGSYLEVPAGRRNKRIKLSGNASTL